MTGTPHLVIAAGGTGGHLFPAQALAETMLARGWRVTLSTDARGARYAGAFPEAVARQVVSAATFARGGVLARLAVPILILAGILSALAAMLRDRPTVVAGFGGYPAIPALAAAWMLRVPRLIHEQNGVPGRVNRIFARRVQRVACGTWPTRLPRGVRAEHTGNPVRRAVAQRAGSPYTPPGDWPIRVLVIGGSQGARLFGPLMPQALQDLDPALRARIRIAQQVRPEDHALVAEAYDALGIAAELSPFFEDVPARLAEAQLVVSRAGASSIADITAIGRPAILIPYAAAADDHQSANAAGLVAAGGAFAITEDRLTPALLAGHIAAILSDPEGAAAMAAAARQAGRPDAADRLADLVETVARERSMR